MYLHQSLYPISTYIRQWKEDIDEYEKLTKEFKKSKKKDKTDNILKTLDKDLDTRDIWMGVRYLKSEYKPQPYQEVWFNLGRYGSFFSPRVGGW